VTDFAFRYFLKNKIWIQEPIEVSAEEELLDKNPDTKNTEK
jgi:hypothetical protein